MEHDNYLMNIFDIIEETSIYKFNNVLNFIEAIYEKYINNYVTLIYHKVNKIQLNKINFDILANNYQDIRSNIFRIKLEIKDDLYTKSLINP